MSKIKWDIRVYLGVNNGKTDDTFMIYGVYQRAGLLRSIGWWFIRVGVRIMFKKTGDWGTVK